MSQVHFTQTIWCTSEWNDCKKLAKADELHCPSEQEVLRPISALVGPRTALRVPTKADIGPKIFLSLECYKVYKRLSTKGQSIEHTEY